MLIAVCESKEMKDFITGFREGNLFALFLLEVPDIDTSGCVGHRESVFKNKGANHRAGTFDMVIISTVNHFVNSSRADHGIFALGAGFVSYFVGIQDWSPLTSSSP